MTYVPELLCSIVFDQNEYFADALEQAENTRQIGNAILQISQLVIDFAAIERVPRYCKFKRENDAEHSFMLALAGIEVVSQHYPGLDSGLAAKLALVHDLPELKTSDVATFDITDEELRQKHLNEAASIPELLKDLPPHIGDLVVIYEEQEMPESRLIKHLDKLLPNAVNINGAGLKVMKEDYGVFTANEFFGKNEKLEARYRNTFTDPQHEPLHLAHAFLANKFALTLPAA